MVIWSAAAWLQLFTVMRFRQIGIYARNLPPLLTLSLLFMASANAQSTLDAPPSPPSFAQIHRLTDQGKFDEALAALTEVSKSDPAPKNLSREFGIIYYRKGDYRQRHHFTSARHRGESQRH